MKKVLLAALCVMTLAACSGDAEKKMEANMNHQRDSLTQVINQKDAELNDILLTMNEIEDGMRLISEAEGRVTVAKTGEGASQKARIQEDMNFIQEQLKKNRELVAKLEGQLRSSTFKAAELQKAIETLTKQVNEKTQEIENLRLELSKKDIHIAKLDEAIDSLNSNVQNLRNESKEKTDVIQDQDKEMHKAWFVFGTKSELKQQKILDGSKVLQGNFNRNYFTEIDIRDMKEIKLYSKSAELLTSHPAGSYTLERDAKKEYVLKIKIPSTFWSTSKYLVIQVK